MAAVVKAWGVVVIRNVVVLVWTWGASCSSVGRWGGRRCGKGFMHRDGLF